MGDQLARLLEEVRKRLIDTGTRNRLIHANRKAKRRSALTLLHGEPDTIFRRLVGENASFRFLADPLATERERRREADDGSEDVDAEYPSSMSSQHGNDAFQTRLGEAGLDRKLTRLAREAKTLEEEQGINILFLAMGFLRWYEDTSSEIEHEAPLILLPVSLVRDLRRSTYTLRAREEHISTNLPLAERLRDQENLRLPEIEEDEGWSPSGYFKSVQKAVAGRTRWAVDPTGFELGFFSFAKLLMFKDLGPDSWPDSKLLGHPLLRRLMRDGFEFETDTFPDDIRIDERFQPADLIHVLDADGSQTLAIETVRAGRNLVIHGPPGTGKSQTIANIIAGAAHDGKSVIFIAEKMVALQVVHDRLKKAGLGELCLELHSRMAHKRALAEALAKTLANGVAEPLDQAETAHLKDVRDTLNRLDAHIHAPIGESETSAFEIIGDLVRAQGLKLPLPTTPVPGAETWSRAEYKLICDTVDSYAAIVAIAGQTKDHPWRGIRNEALQPPDLARIERDAPLAAEKARGLRLYAEAAAKVCPLPAPVSASTVARMRQFLDLLAAIPLSSDTILAHVLPLTTVDLARARECIAEGAELSSRIETEARNFRPDGLAADVTECRSHILAGKCSFLARWRSSYRKSSSKLEGWLAVPLPRRASERLALLDRLADLQARRSQFGKICKDGLRLIGPQWGDDATDWSAVDAALEWCPASGPMRQIKAVGQRRISGSS
jgi:hypothetical protein